MVCSSERNRLRKTLAGSLELMPAEMTHLFDQFFGSAAQQPQSWPAPATLYEQGDHYTVEIDMPGVKQDALELTYEKGTLSISAERKATEAEAEDRKVWHEERGYGNPSSTVTAGSRFFRLFLD
jgi:HSP20 family protein